MNKKIATFLFILYVFIEVISFFNFTFFSFLSKYNVLFSLFVLVLIALSDFSLFSQKTFLFFLVISLLLIGSVFINSGSFGSILNIFCLIIGFYVFSKIKISKNYYKCIIFLFLLLLVYFIYKSNNVLYTTIYYKNSDFNSNTVAQVILYINMFLFLYFSKYKLNSKILYIFLLPISFYGIINTQSRGAALSYIVFIILHIFRNFKIVKNKSSFLITLFSIIGTIFPIVYLNMYKNGVNFVIPYMNKSLFTGRENLWLYAYEKLTSSTLKIFTGLGANFVIEGQETLNLHNMFFALIVNFGVVIFLILMFWFKRFINKNIRNEYRYCIIPIVLLSFFETTILWNAILIYIYLIESIIVNDNSNSKKEVII